MSRWPARRGAGRPGTYAHGDRKAEDQNAAEKHKKVAHCLPPSAFDMFKHQDHAERNSNVNHIGAGCGLVEWVHPRN
jgi:hypothetical protein